MATTYNPPRILILLIQIERDHLNNQQALLAVLPLHGPWARASSIQGAKGISVTTPHSLLRALRGSCTAIAVRGDREQQGMGPDERAVSLGKYHEQHGKGCNTGFRGSGQPSTATT